MIDPKILDAVLPVPDLDELRDSMIEDLKNEGFVISNFHSGGIFHTRSGKATFSKTFLRDIRLKFWKIMPNSRRSSLMPASERVPTSRPITLTEPPW